MARPLVRLALVSTGVAAIAAAGLFVWSSESGARTADASLRLAVDAGRRALLEASDLRAAQQAYVAVGQGEDFWFARVASHSKDLDDVLTLFRGRLTSPEAIAAADSATGALRDFQQLDARAREYTRARQLAQASDVIFGDGFDLTQKLTAAVTQAVSAEAVAHDAAAASARRREAIAIGAAAGIAVLALLLLIPGGAPRQVDTAADTGSSPEPGPAGTLDELGDAGLHAWPAANADETSVDLAAVAAVCGDLARVTDTRAVPALLERAAAVLDAAGIVLWIADPDGQELSPILVHGYSPQLATRLGTITRGAANVTASAYRTGLVQTVKGDAVSNGAIAAPLVGPGGCLGVMAVEMRNGGEQRQALLAAATIIASQLSTLVGPPSARGRTEAAG